jgi:hypothetical protein
MARILILPAAALTVWATVGAAQAYGGRAAEKEPVVVVKAVRTQLNTPEVGREIDADQAYKANCARCHLPPRKLSEGKMATVMRHMRVRANLTAEETDAILGYLTR